MNYGQGAPAFQSLPLPGSGGAPFPAGSADNGLSVDPISGTIQFGSGVGNPLDSQLVNDRILAMDVFKWEFFRVGSESIFKLDPNNDEYRLGKESTGAGVIVQAGAGGGVILQLNNAGLFQGSANALQIGASDFGYPHMNFSVGGASTEVTTLSFANSGGTFPGLRFQFTPGTELFFVIGDVNSALNSTRLLIDDFNAEIRLTASNGIFTESGGGGWVPGGWLLGQKKAAAVVVDATQYLEVSVDGVIYKLVVAA